MSKKKKLKRLDKELKGAGWWDYPQHEGKPLFSTAHPMTVSEHSPSNDADLSIAAMEMAWLNCKE